MALGDGIRRNIAHVDPAERAMLRDALIELNQRKYPGSRNDALPGGVSWWFKMDEIHQATHVHRGPEFLPWHREVVNYMESQLRLINPQLSMHYWDWTQDPRSIPNANLGGGVTGTLNLFSADFMGYGGASLNLIGAPWQTAGYYVPGANPHRDGVGGTAADPPVAVNRSVNGLPIGSDNGVITAGDYAVMRNLLEASHDAMHGFVNMGGQHISFRDPFVFLLHSNVDRLFAKWQTNPTHLERVDPATVYGSEANLDVLVSGHIQNVNHNIEPWSSGHGEFNDARPWAAPESQGIARNYKHPSIVFPPCYDTNDTAIPLVQVLNSGLPPVVNFNDVPTGETAVRAAIFRIYGCGNVTVRVKAGAGPAVPFSIIHPASGNVVGHHGANLYVDVRIWLAFTAGAAMVPVADGSVTFECPENGKEFAFVLKANAISRPRVAIMLALDQSGSMAWPAGTSGVSRIDVLKDAARTFMELIPQNNGVGLIRFDHNAYAVNDPTFPGLPVTPITTNDINPGRVAAIAAANAHTVNPAGNTSVGDGVDRARQILNALPMGDYDRKAMIVLTDGLENDPLWIADVTGSIDNRTFAIGLGNESQVNTTALRALTQNTGGYLLLTGLLSASIDDYFRLRKYFQQILSGVTNNSIILDPSGSIAPGTEVRIPFRLNEADIDCTALLMLDENVVEFYLETPDGKLIRPADAPGLGISYIVGTQNKYYRFTLPVAVGAGQQSGVWQVVLRVNDDDFKKTLSVMRRRKDERFQAFATHGARYSVVIDTYSNLRMSARSGQNGYEPGATLTFQTTLTEYGIPVEHRAQAQVELTRPGNSLITLPLNEVEPGLFEATTQATTAGIYYARFMARGVTWRGVPFTREQSATAAVWAGGNQPYQPPRGTTGKEDLCRLLTCLLSEKNLSKEFEERLKKEGINLNGIRQCVKSICG
jgi:hypothetical protein